MSNQQAFRDVIVSNNPTLLASGDSTNLAIGQVGIFNYDPKKPRTATAAPTYAQNRAIQIALGTPPVPTNLLGAVADQTKVSKPIKGKAIINWQGAAARRGATQIITIGFDGFDTTKTLTAKCEEDKTVFIKLSGGPIEQAFHTEGRGLVREYALFSGCCDDCGDDCANVSAEKLADDLVNQINTDPILSLGTATNSPYVPSATPTNRLIIAKKIIGAAAPAPDSTCTQYLLNVCDNGDDTSLGVIQASYPGYIITRINRLGSTSTYQMIRPVAAGAPAVFQDSGLPIISDCPVCPSGYTLSAGGFAATVQRIDAGTAGALTTLKSDYGVVAPETAIRLIYQFGTSTYLIETTNEVTVVGTDTLVQLGETRNKCVITQPLQIVWQAGLTYNSFDQVYTITLKDNVCGDSRLAELQAYYPALTIVDNGPGTSDNCVHQFQTTIPSICSAPGCPPDSPIFVGPDAYLGVLWTATPAAENNTVVGVQIEGAYVDLLTNECAYKFWQYDAEPIFIEASQHSQDYNAKPTICADEWPVTEIQPIQIPSGVGSRVRDEEIYFKGYDRKYWDVNPIVRQYQDSIVQADPLRYYDSFTLEFGYSYHEFWFSEKFTDTYRLEVYFPEGTGAQYQNAINGYVASIGIDIPPVAIV